MNKIPSISSFEQSDIVALQAMPTGGGSDATLKRDVTDLPFTIEQILSLRPVTWNWKNESAGTRREYGFIAQELEKELPGLVYDDVWIDGTKRKFISSQALLPYLVAAIKELQGEIDEMKIRLDE